MRAHTGRDHDIKAGRPSGARRRQTVRAEVPILCYEKEELWPPRRAGRRGDRRGRFSGSVITDKATSKRRRVGSVSGISLMHLPGDGLDNRRGDRAEGALGSHPGNRCGRLHRQSAVRRARRARPCGARALPASGGTDPGRRASPDRRYRPHDRLVAASRPYRHRRASRQPRAPFRAQTADHNEEQAAQVLAHSAAKAGVRRLIHMSSVRAMGDATPPGVPFRAADPPRPRDPYGRGKLAIERALLAAAQESGIEIVILRAPLVYGPGVKANFRALMRLVASRLPLPLAGIDNRRSLIFIDNLVDLVGRACLHPWRGRAGAAGARRGRPVDTRADPPSRRRAGEAGPALWCPATRFGRASPSSDAGAIARPADALAAGR